MIVKGLYKTTNGKVRPLKTQGFSLTSKRYVWVLTDFISENKVMGNGLRSKTLRRHV